jgi:acetyl esterase/lipase
MGREILDLPAPPADVRLAYGPNEYLFGDLRLPPGAGPHKLMVMIHGGFWRARYDLNHMGHACAALATVGVATWNVEYRRNGQNGSSWQVTLDDASAACKFTETLSRTYSLDLSRTAIAGFSAGGHLALCMAARKALPNLACAVSLAGVADLHRAWELKIGGEAVHEFIGASPHEDPASYATASPIQLLPFGIPTRLIHGTADDIVPVEISSRFVARASALGEDSTLIHLPEAGHFELIDPQSREWPVVQATLLKFLV